MEIRSEILFSHVPLPDVPLKGRLCLGSLDHLSPASDSLIWVARVAAAKMLWIHSVSRGTTSWIAVSVADRGARWSASKMVDRPDLRTRWPKLGGMVAKIHSLPFWYYFRAFFNRATTCGACPTIASSKPRSSEQENRLIIHACKETMKSNRVQPIDCRAARDLHSTWRRTDQKPLPKWSAPLCNIQSLTPLPHAIPKRNQKCLNSCGHKQQPNQTSIPLK